MKTDKEIWEAMIEDSVCPVCGGDCGSANPPVLFCPMQQKTVDTTDDLHQILGQALAEYRRS